MTIEQKLWLQSHRRILAPAYNAFRRALDANQIAAHIAKAFPDLVDAQALAAGMALPFTAFKNLSPKDSVKELTGILEQYKDGVFFSSRSSFNDKDLTHLLTAPQILAAIDAHIKLEYAGLLEFYLRAFPDIYAGTAAISVIPIPKLDELAPAATDELVIMGLNEVYSGRVAIPSDLAERYPQAYIDRSEILD